MVGAGVVQKLAGDVAGVDLGCLSSSAAVGGIGRRILDLFGQFGLKVGYGWFLGLFGRLMGLEVSLFGGLMGLEVSLFGRLMGLEVVRGDLVVIFVVVHVGHEDFFGVFLVDEDIGLYEFDASVVDADVDPEIVAEEVEEILPFDEGVEGVCFSGEDEDGSEEVDEDGVHDGAPAEALLHGGVALAEEPEKLGDQLFELQIAEDLWVVILVEHKFEILVVDDLLYFADVALEVHALDLEAEFQVLVVKDPNVGLGIVEEGLDHSCGVDEVALEEGGEGCCVGKEWLLDAVCELFQGSHLKQQSLLLLIKIIRIEIYQSTTHLSTYTTHLSTYYALPLLLLTFLKTVDFSVFRPGEKGAGKDGDACWRVVVFYCGKAFL